MKTYEWKTWLDTRYFPGDLRWFYCPAINLSARFYGVWTGPGQFENYLELTGGRVLVETINELGER